jgi:hypothetical protein
LAKKGLESHWVILFDDRDNLFTIRGPVKDDTDVTNKVVDLQKTGRAIRCQTVPVSAHPTRSSLIDTVKRQFEQQLTFNEGAFDDV